MTLAPKAYHVRNVRVNTVAMVHVHHDYAALHCQLRLGTIQDQIIDDRIGVTVVLDVDDPIVVPTVPACIWSSGNRRLCGCTPRNKSRRERQYPTSDGRVP